MLIFENLETSEGLAEPFHTGDLADDPNMCFQSVMIFAIAPSFLIPPKQQ